MIDKTRGTLEMTAAMVISGTIGWFVVRSGQPVIDLLFWRCAFGAATLLAVCAALGMLRGKLSLRLLGWAALGGVAIVLNWLLIFASFSRASIAIATTVYNTQPFMMVALGALLFSERVSSTQLGWLGIAFAGVVLIVQAKPGASYTGADYVAGVLMALGAAFFYAVAAMITKKLSGTPPHMIALAQVCVGIVMIAPFANLSALPADARAWGSFAVMGVIYTGLVFVLLYGAIQKLPTHAVGALSFVYPVVAIGVDMVAFDHRLQLEQLAGAAAILVAAAGLNLGWSFKFSRTLRP
ncbi:O-acetylserine/cysteine export protein [Variovorax sp. PBL-H6]|uniref:DMT family transporter n=1 Tax=Variovorax sp. PBL-H6 TaxID=434009 RepID=UPI001316A6BC|nr:DMT family transporter [Variovorax sp. PBL-H6]VTU21128.1 O-acetylserine/cysteine export protein [Variovorax sp. PBL-H6]